LGLFYHSTHKFRHGHAVYALMLAKNIAELKAVSQNLMHTNISTTDGIYGMLSDAEIKDQLNRLGKTIPKSEVENENLISSLKEIVRLLETNNRR
jgi:site-specific recombinase XerC